MTADTIMVSDEKYSGMYIAQKDFGSKEVVSFGPDPERALKDAKEKGCESPVIFFVPDKGSVHIY